ncbi:MAG: hypothetical protein HY815_18355 [Candidatus Riflebacteria bacterium]|nr:hypothetical protein [Candidatus Riflebacteria bacterium]
MQRTFMALEAVVKDIPRDTFDPGAVLEKAGRDPSRLFEWVRDNTNWVPYRGALRGPVGVLMDRVGSHLDRALLLAELLRQAKYQVRLARGGLSRETAAQLLANGWPVSNRAQAPAVPVAREALEQSVADLAARFNLDPAQVKAEAVRLRLRAEAIAAEVEKRSKLHTQELNKVWSSIGAEAAAGGGRAVEDDSCMASMQDLWWVEYLDGADWVPLCPVAGGAVKAPASILPAAVQTYGLDKPGGAFPLDTRDCHEVTIRIVVERWDAGGREELHVLSHVLRPMELLGQRIAVRHVPMNWSKHRRTLVTSDGPSGQALHRAVLAEREWLPVVTVGSTVIAGSSFTASGQTDSTAASRLKSFLDGGTTGARIASMLGSGRLSPALAKDDLAPAAQDGRLTAEWLEFEIRAPSAPQRVIRRHVFDLVGPARRAAAVRVTAPPTVEESQRLERGLSLLGETEVLLLPCQLSAEFVQHAAATATLANSAALVALVGKTDLRKPDAVARSLRDARPMSTRLWSLARARQTLSRVNSDVYLDRLNILSHHSTVVPGSDGQVSICRHFDIVANELAVRPGREKDAARVRIEQGVVDSNAELALASSPCGTARSAAAPFSPISGTIGEDWVVVRRLGGPEWAKIEVPPDVRTRIEADVSTGHVVVVAPRGAGNDGSVHHAWWRIDPVTGDTLAIDGHGHGGAHSTENALIVSTVVASVVWSVCLLGFHHDIGTCAVETFGGAIVELATASVLIGLIAGNILGRAAGGDHAAGHGEAGGGSHDASPPSDRGQDDAGADETPGSGHADGTSR